MTELYIAGQAVVLPENLSMTLTEDNPEITNNGDFSWDVEVSLLNPVNAKIFKHLNRINITVISISLDAKLVVDNKIRNGKIIILSTIT